MPVSGKEEQAGQQKKKEGVLIVSLTILTISDGL
jgi:hypothetical protein